MLKPYQLGLADSSTEFNMIARFAADNVQGYDTRHHVAWVYEKLRPRMEDSRALPYVAVYDGQPVAVAIAYPDPPQGSEQLPSVEFKLVRTIEPHGHWGLGRAAMQGAFNTACIAMALAPGTVVRNHLDTRDYSAQTAFELMGFVAVGQAMLYDDEPDRMPDVLLEKRVVVPPCLYERP